MSKPSSSDEQLVERLLLLVVAAAAGIGAAGAAERVELVDEDDARRLLPRLLEQVAHARRADADEHLDEFRAVDREERHARLAGDGARQQRLAGAGRPDQQHALRHVRAEPAVPLRVLQERDDLLQFLLGLVDAGDVGEGHLGVGLDVDLGLAAADRHQPAEPLLAGEAAEHEQPHAEEQRGRHTQDRRSSRKVLCTFPANLTSYLSSSCGDLGGDPRGDELGVALFVRRLEFALDVLAADAHLGDLAGLEIVLELAVGDLDLSLGPELLDQHDGEIAATKYQA